jgi:hypothetical protein
MSDEPKYEPYYFMVEMLLPSTPDSPVDEEEIASLIKETLESESLLDMAKDITIHAPQARIRMMTPDTLDDLPDEALEMMAQSIFEQTGEEPDSHDRAGLLAFLKSGMEDALEERRQSMH